MIFVGSRYRKKKKLKHDARSSNDKTREISIAIALIFRSLQNCFHRKIFRPPKPIRYVIFTFSPCALSHQLRKITVFSRSKNRLISTDLTGIFGFTLITYCIQALEFTSFKTSCDFPNMTKMCGTRNTFEFFLRKLIL